jgi:hypothetical protein
MSLAPVFVLDGHIPTPLVQASMSVTYWFVPFSVTVSVPASTWIGALQLPMLTEAAPVVFVKPEPDGPVIVKP